MHLLFHGIQIPFGYCMFSRSLLRTYLRYFVGMAAGKLKGELNAEQSEVTSLQFSSDGTLLVSGGADGTIKVWDFLTGAYPYSLSLSLFLSALFVPWFKRGVWSFLSFCKVFGGIEGRLYFGGDLNFSIFCNFQNLSRKSVHKTYALGFELFF